MNTWKMGWQQSISLGGRIHIEAINCQDQLKVRLNGSRFVFHSSICINLVHRPSQPQEMTICKPSDVYDGGDLHVRFQ